MVGEFSWIGGIDGILLGGHDFCKFDQFACVESEMWQLLQGHCTEWIWRVAKVGSV